MSEQIAICPGSYDPVTNGHLDIIGRAASLPNSVIRLRFPLSAGRCPPCGPRAGRFALHLVRPGRRPLREPRLARARSRHSAWPWGKQLGGEHPPLLSFSQSALRRAGLWPEHRLAHDRPPTKMHQCMSAADVRACSSRARRQTTARARHARRHALRARPAPPSARHSRVAGAPDTPWRACGTSAKV